ncbi:MAG: hypothetical protein V4585_05290 [Bacteroidota bacterium]
MEAEGKAPIVYELFICDSWGYQENTLMNGADASFMRNLQISERNPIHTQDVGTTLQLLNDVKKHIVRAIEQFSAKSKLLESEKLVLTKMKHKLISAETSEEIKSIILLAEPIRDRLANI